MISTTFCRRMHVQGSGDPHRRQPAALSPPSITVYPKPHRNYGFGIAILGNPTPIDRIRRLMDTRQAPLLPDQPRGAGGPQRLPSAAEGHFKRSLAFLDGLRALGVYTMVMLTLTRDNLDQVLPSGGTAQGPGRRSFTFNRLSTVGEGASLLMPERSGPLRPF
jgi:hypothetical protein